jgi:hypothetical protein
MSQHFIDAISGFVELGQSHPIVEESSSQDSEKEEE